MIDKIFVEIFKVFSKQIFAEGYVGSGDGGSNPLGSSNPPKLSQLVVNIENLFDYILPIGALIAVAMIIYGGYMWIISGGDPSRKQMAQGTLTWSVIGLVFLFLIKAILTLIAEFVVG